LEKIKIRNRSIKTVLRHSMVFMLIDEDKKKKKIKREP